MLHLYFYLLFFAFIIYPINNINPIFRCNVDRIKHKRHNESEINENQFKMFNLNNENLKIIIFIWIYIILKKK